MSIKVKGHPKLKPAEKRIVDIAPPPGVPMKRWIILKGINRTTLVEQLKRGNWQVNGKEGAQKFEGRWYFHPEAELVFPERRVPKKRGYPRDERKIQKRKIGSKSKYM